MPPEVRSITGIDFTPETDSRHPHLHGWPPPGGGELKSKPAVQPPSQKNQLDENPLFFPQLPRKGRALNL